VIAPGRDPKSYSPDQEPQVPDERASSYPQQVSGSTRSGLDHGGITESCPERPSPDSRIKMSFPSRPSPMARLRAYWVSHAESGVLVARRRGRAWCVAR
jgi:hypothetical protein